MAGADRAGAEFTGSDSEGGEVAGLVAAARSGDAEAWRALVARYLDLVWSIARGHSLDHCDAADVTQTTWLRLHEHLPRLKDPARVGAWLATTARRESLRVLRDQRRQFPAPLEERRWERATSASSAPPADDSLPEAEEDRRNRDLLLWQAFDELTPSCQALLRALIADPRPTYSEVSAALSIAIGSIGPTRARCLERLKANWFAATEPSRRGDMGVPGKTRKNVGDARTDGEVP